MTSRPGQWPGGATFAGMGITDVEGIRVGHWTDAEARTGCTVVLLPEGAITSGEVRGAAPATREFALLDPLMSVPSANAVVLTGGSAFGLASCDGVMQWLEEAGTGFETPAGIVPIVVGIACFDLMVGDPTVRPGAVEGRAACAEAWSSEVNLSGAVGAGTGCTVGKWRDPDEKRSSGLGSATLRHGGLIVSALIACNAVGWPAGSDAAPASDLPAPFWAPGSNTTIGFVATNARLDKTECRLVAQSGHDGYARALEPVHTGLDGDALVVAATGEVEADRDLCRALAARVVEAAIGSIPFASPT